MKSTPIFYDGGPGRARTSNQTVMSRQVVTHSCVAPLGNTFLLVVTKIDTQALPRGEAKLPNSLIGLVAEEGLEPPTRGL